MPRRFPAMLAIVGCLACAAHAGAAEALEDAAAVIERYLAMPHPPDDRIGEARSARLAVLDQLKDAPDGAGAIIAALHRVNDPRQRCELVEALRHFPGEQSAAVLRQLLDDPDDSVRREAIGQLRLLARRVDRTGGKRTQRGADLEPKVDGLVPDLARAAGDAVEANRLAALYALADARDPAGIVELRRALRDDSEHVRLMAACFLTEYQDASGLPEMRNALKRLKEDREDRSKFRAYIEAEMVLASMERITGKSFGEIPMNPGLFSDHGAMAAAEAQFARLIDAWLEWWAWEPKAR